MAMIGKRAYEEAVQVFGSPKLAALTLGVAEKTVYHWHGKGYTPNANTLATMLKFGCDIDYILIGERKSGKK